MQKQFWHSKMKPSMHFSRSSALKWTKGVKWNEFFWDDMATSVILKSFEREWSSQEVYCLIIPKLPGFWWTTKGCFVWSTSALDLTHLAVSEMKCCLSEACQSEIQPVVLVLRVRAVWTHLRNSSVWGKCRLISGRKKTFWSVCSVLSTILWFVRYGRRMDNGGNQQCFH